jgi:oligopeptide transport system ATP-binding protein
VEKILEVENLHISFKTYSGEVKAVRGASFDLNKGETLAIVGESGCGKSVTSQAIMKLIPTPPATYNKGKIRYQGQDVIAMDEKQMSKIRGKEVAMIFQDPMTSLNPTMTVGDQLTEGIRKHQNVSTTEAKKKALDMLKLVGIPNPESRFKQYPHQFSGGQKQRVMIAMALSCNPNLLIADEPTTALDVTIQAQIMDLMKNLQVKFGTSIILITHDLGVVAETADRVTVMYAGQVVETGTIEEIFKDPRHPYTWGLLNSMPKINQNRGEELSPIPGAPPDLSNPPKGCAFAARCKHAMKICREHDPELSTCSDTHRVFCWLEHPMAKSANELATSGGE